MQESLQLLLITSRVRRTQVSVARGEPLRKALDVQLRVAAERVTPGFADFVTEHIGIKGTFVGGVIDTVLYLVAQTLVLSGRCPRFPPLPYEEARRPLPVDAIAQGISN
ncbi:hypothetical protein [Pandoraea oxalativorans]|uniref:Uncharacterized protein n=1 Tax=Pandoraea oxalativorans TaxID=573737 RepID=A0A0G3IBC3_9BURK|nr:hypothetical protein [Pandoraea oxalativorans]AKK23906.2 hypothetical protein MB84_25640 [Pandoraea oxalativorans]